MCARETKRGLEGHRLNLGQGGAASGRHPNINVNGLAVAEEPEWPDLYIQKA